MSRNKINKFPTKFYSLLLMQIRETSKNKITKDALKVITYIEGFFILNRCLNRICDLHEVFLVNFIITNRSVC